MNPPKTVNLKERKLVQMDEFLLFLSHPGGFRTPDKRAITRLTRSILIRQTPDCSAARRNQFSVLAPSYVHETLPGFIRRMVIATRPDPNVPLNDAIIHAIVLAWAVANGSPLCFQSLETATMVKRALDALDQRGNHKAPGAGSDERPDLPDYEWCLEALDTPDTPCKRPPQDCNPLGGPDGGERKRARQSVGRG